MPRILHDLACLDDRRISPYCWRSKFALAHKGLEFEARPQGFLDIPRLYGGGHRTVPILDDDGHVVPDSWAIADYLDARYPDRPRLFEGPAERALCRFTEAWLFGAFVSELFPMVALDIHDHARPEDRAYFRENREQRLGRSLEAATEGREERLPDLRSRLQPLRITFAVQGQPFLSGEQAGYADYIAAGVLFWVASVTTLPLLERDDPVVEWFERMRDLHGGLGRTTPMYAIAA
ncbi:glutathione S-transferase N-terminal domain-containing protein [Nannocystis punicea]|uniref:Glutathione S-transferase N-terminal domain-containing protein n=1 Tax=Nannocystis punicea TaxID=2995304 RepID=A0ABY7H8M6_9BACT|nr:glutathione S-transferase N-terminal domain-containing protein [Nannocystis poenicansa]WAS95625.1 glutathione S-transferase N-terminal domain-containing protein [Nannocystis poenicansa]